jgi:N-acetylglucosaminyl-diphospho-decaprenol L-rhamnosyltransferase
MTEIAPVISIVVVNYRTPELTAKCLKSIQERLDVPARVEVVDTSNGPGTVRSEHLVTHIPVSYLENVGYASALNFGFLDATTPLLLAMNADTELPANGIGPLVALFAEHPKLAILGPRQVNPDGYIVHAGIPTVGDPGGGRSFGERDTGQHTERILEMGQVSGSVMLIRRDAFNALGGMPTTRLYFEDSLLCLKAARDGWAVAYSGLRTFTHHVAASPEPEGSSRIALAMESQRAFQEVAACA